VITATSTPANLFSRLGASSGWTSPGPSVSTFPLQRSPPQFTYLALSIGRNRTGETSSSGLFDLFSTSGPHCIWDKGPNNPSAGIPTPHPPLAAAGLCGLLFSTPFFFPTNQLCFRIRTTRTDGSGLSTNISVPWIPPYPGGSTVIFPPDSFRGTSLSRVG